MRYIASSSLTGWSAYFSFTFKRLRNKSFIGLNDVPACTDLTTKPWVIESGFDVLNQSFFAKENIATAGGCLASKYLATWIISKLVDKKSADRAIHYVAPVGEKDATVKHCLSIVSQYI